MKEKVIDFINRFTDNGRKKEVIDTFTNGCCYWFSRILLERFDGAYIAALVYDEVINHFGVEINGEVYDVTGVVTDKYHWIKWSNLSDDILKRRIIRDCINF